jgi:hypothetical protein
MYFSPLYSQCNERERGSDRFLWLRARRSEELNPFSSKQLEEKSLAKPADYSLSTIRLPINWAITLTQSGFLQGILKQERSKQAG